jgi:hypothetical protein
MIFKKSARTSKRTQHFAITNIDLLMLQEMMHAYTENL